MSAATAAAAPPAVSRPHPGALPPRALALVGVLATAVSAAGSWVPSLWYDEVATLTAATRSWGDLWALLQQTNAVQGVFYALMHLWVDLAGTSAVALRLPAALAVGAGAVGVAVLAGRVLPRSSVVAAAAVFALLPRMTWAGVEARPYALAAALAVWAAVALLLALDRGGLLRWLLYAALAALGTAVFVYVALAVVAHAAVVWLSRTTALRRRLEFTAAAAAAAVASTPVVLLSAGQTSQLGIDERPSVAWVARRLLVNEFFLGNTPSPISESLKQASPAPGELAWTAAAVGLALVGWVLVAVGLLRWPSSPPAGRVRVLLVTWVALPAVVIGGLSIAVTPLYGPRYLVFAAPAVAVLLGHGLAQLPRRWPRLLAVVLCLVLVAPVYASQRGPHAKSAGDWEDVASYVEVHASRGDAVYFTPRYRDPSGPAGPSTVRQAAVAYPRAFAGLDDLTVVRSAARSASLVADDEPLADAVDRLGGHRVVWVVQRLDHPAGAAAADAALLREHGFAGGVVWRGPQDEVLRYERQSATRSE